MKKYLAVYTGSPEGEGHKRWGAMDETTRKKQEKAGMEAWGNWVTKNKKSIVEMGSPVGKTKQINSKGVSDIRNNIAAFTVVQAENYEAAAQLFLEHPHFTIFPGDSVEIMECLPIPGM